MMKTKMVSANAARKHIPNVVGLAEEALQGAARALEALADAENAEATGAGDVGQYIDNARRAVAFIRGDLQTIIGELSRVPAPPSSETRIRAAEEAQ